MRRFKVITTSVGGHNNKIYYYDQEVTEENFPEGNADKLVTGGYLKEIIEEPAATPAQQNEAQVPVAGSQTETGQATNNDKPEDNQPAPEQNVTNSGNDQQAKESQANKKGPGKK